MSTEFTPTSDQLRPSNRLTLSDQQLTPSDQLTPSEQLSVEEEDILIEFLINSKKLKKVHFNISEVF